MESGWSRGIAGALAVGVLAAPLLAACGSRLGTGLPDLTSATQASVAPSATPAHTPASISDPRSLGATRVTLGQRAEPYGQFVSPILTMINPQYGMPVGAVRQVGAYPGFIYVYSGTVTMKDSTGLVDVHAGEARAIPRGLWEEQNTGPALAAYALIFLNDNAARNETWNGGVVLMSPMLDSPKGVTFQLVLDIVAIDAGGRSESLAHGGAVAIFVLAGAVEVREPNQKHEFVGAGEAVYVPPH